MPPFSRFKLQRLRQNTTHFSKVLADCHNTQLGVTFQHALMSNFLTVNQTLIQATMPVFSCDLSPYADALRLAREAIDELRAVDPTPIESNVKSKYVSPWDSHRRNSKLEPVCELILSAAKEASRSFLTAGFDGLNIDYFVKDCWGIIYEGEDYTTRHNHFPSDISCALYLEAEAGCAPIIFEGHVAVHPRDNLLVLFPGILQHEVPKTAAKRTVISANLFKTMGLIR